MKSWLKNIWNQVNIKNKNIINLSEVINIKRFNDVEWYSIHKDIEKYSLDKHVFHNVEGEYNRKGYEWTQCIYGLKKLGMLNPNYSGLGVGAGKEAIIYYLSEKIKSVVASDLYGNETWASGEAPKDIIGNPEKYCPKKIDFSKIHFQNANGLNLPFEDNSFNFIWSLSSIEHFGSHENASKAVREMSRCVKKGGIVCIASEYLLLPEYKHPEFFTKEEIQKYIIDASENLELVDEINWELPPIEFLIDSVVFRDEKHGYHRRRRHIVMNQGNVQWTSFIIFMRKI